MRIGRRRFGARSQDRNGSKHRPSAQQIWDGLATTEPGGSRRSDPAQPERIDEVRRVGEMLSGAASPHRVRR